MGIDCSFPKYNLEFLRVYPLEVSAENASNFADEEG
jgi:hypothetical protein